MAKRGIDTTPLIPASAVAASYWVAVGAALTLTALQLAVAGTEAPATAEAAPQRVAFVDRDATAASLAALESIEFDWRSHLPDWTIEFVPATGGPAAGFTWTRERRIEVFTRPDDEPERLARVLAHELGHAIDVELNTPADRERWVIQRGLHGIPWWPDSARRDFATGAGDFAEVVASWLTGDADFRSEVGRLPTSEDLALVEQLARG